MPLQITLTDAIQNPKIFRTLIVPSQGTFADLEEFISIAFDFTHPESFFFKVTKSNGKTITPVFIGAEIEEPMFFTEDELLDDEEELLKDWFKQEGDVATYEVPSIDMELSITVDKILPEVLSKPCPACIAGKGDLHSGKLTFVDIHDISETMQFMHEVDNDDLHELLDDNILDLLEETDDIEELLEAMEVEPDYKGLLEIATSLKNTKPWEYVHNDEVFVIENPFTQDLIFVSVLGAGGQEYGLSLYLNEQGYETLQTIFSGAKPTTEFIHELDSLTISFVDREELSTEDYQLIKDAGFSYRGKKNWIQFRTYDPGQFPWLPDAHGVETLKLASAITLEHIETVKKGWTYPNLPENCFPVYYVNEKNGEWEQKVMNFTLPEKYQTHEVYLDLPKHVTQELRNLKKSSLEIEFDLSYMDRAVQESKDERPYYPLLAIAIDKKTGMVIFHDIIPLPKEPELAQAVLLGILETIQVKPKAIHVLDAMESYLKPIAQLAGITLKKSKLPAIQRFYSEFSI